MKSKIIKNIFLVICLLILFLSIYIKINFNDVSFEQLVYSLFTSKGSSPDVIFKGATFVILCCIISILFIYIFKFLIIKTSHKFPRKTKKHVYVTFEYKSKKFKTDLLEFTKAKINTFYILFLILLLIVSIKLIGIDKFIISQFNSTTIFEDYYVSAKDVDIRFPDKKKNLIYIYVESLETTNASIENGGAMKKSSIPNLESLALSENNVHFSNTSKLGGALTLAGTDWTAAAMVAQTAGVPLKLSIDTNHYYGYGASLPGVYNLGDILKANGYKNYLFIGSDAEFGGRKDYFTYHGDYTIHDYEYAKKKQWIDDDYYTWWGYEDKKLFEFAKEDLLEISKNEEPFNFTLLTADTHFEEGYLDESCDAEFDYHYSSSFACSDKMINEFLSWIKKQDFYEDTTIIVVGDHLTMQGDYLDHISADFDRNVYNLFINSSAKTKNTKDRIFSTVDMFPTTLVSLGVDIEGEKLGLGTNLFSDKKTLSESLGHDYINGELIKKSFFYDNYLLGSTYYKMEKELEKEKK